MKTVACFSIALLSICDCFGQLTKGNWLIGGNGKLYSYTSSYRNSTYNTDAKFTETDLAVSLGYFFVDKLGLGLRPQFSWKKGHGLGATSGVVTNVKHFVIGPLARWYFLSTDKPYNILTDVSYQLGINDWHGQSGNINTFSIMAGPAIFFNNCVGIEFLFGYSSRKENIKDTYTDKNRGFQASVGFQIHLEKE
ncbi:MAG TPA: hypothetical protein VNT20_15700 [Flavisolibacter sp.]|nr:hypothetical protein [Flavisolibacter sp.]